MSQAPRGPRVRRLADSVWPGRTVDGYANLIATRLRKLAAAGSTGMLPVSGRGDGAVFFRLGQVAWAESSRTPPPAPPRSDLAVVGYPGGENGGGVLVAAPSLRRLAGLVALAEPTLDAITDLLASESRYGKFRTDVIPDAPMGPLSVGNVLAEVARRRQVLRQLAPVVTPDTAIARSVPPAGPAEGPAFQVSAPQWALLVRVGEGSTPRSLALTLERSVFGTTIEIYRLLALGLVTLPGRRDREPGGRGNLGGRRPGEIISFLRAVSDAGGEESEWR